MTLYELLKACGIKHNPALGTESPDRQVVVKRKDQHPCDPPLGAVVDYHYNSETEKHEILIS